MEAYFEELEQRASACYDLVAQARKAGYDLEDEAEIPRARDLAERVEAQVGRRVSRRASAKSSLGMTGRLRRCWSRAN